MPIGHEDIAVGRDDHIGRPIERIGAIARHTSLSERHQQRAVRTELEDLMTLVAPCVRAVGCIGNPHITGAIHIQAMRDDEEAGAETPHDPAIDVDLQDWREHGIRAVGRAAALGDPNRTAVAIDIHRTRRSHDPTRRQCQPPINRAIGIRTVVNRSIR